MPQVITNNRSLGVLQCSSCARWAFSLCPRDWSMAWGMFMLLTVPSSVMGVCGPPRYSLQICSVQLL